MRQQIVALWGGSSAQNKALDEILDDAWAKGSDGYDLDDAARRRGVEITLI
jgi:hypothetical protein